MNPNTLKQWLYRGEIEKLENVVLEGRGSRLLGERSPDLRTRVFLKGLPNYLTKISQIHDAVVRGSLSECQKLVSEEPKKKLPLAKDSTGTPLIQKAVYYDHQDIVEWLSQQFPETIHQKDREGRTALHYCAACREPELIWDILIEADCDASICDKKGNPAAYYLDHHSEIELPEADRMVSRKVISQKENLEFKPSNIRIWIHNRDIGKLQQVLWEGHGTKLRCETSNNPRVKRFLEAVPFMMGTIKELHARAIKNDVEGFKRKIADPVSPIILCSKDLNGHNALHKAAGLGNLEIAREILELYPAALFAQDNDGKTPLHYAAAAAAKDGGLIYNLLVEFGADEGKLDSKFKAPAFYKNRPTDVDMSTLSIIPDAPRVSGTYPKNWDWRILETDDNMIREIKKSTSKIAEIAEIEDTFNHEDSPTKMKNGTHETEPEEEEKEEEKEEEDKEEEDKEEEDKKEEEDTQEENKEEEDKEEEEEDPVLNFEEEDNSQAVENEEPDVNSPENSSPLPNDDSKNSEEEKEKPEENSEESPEVNPDENLEENTDESPEESPEENPEENLEAAPEEAPEENAEGANQEGDDNNNVDAVKNTEQEERADASTGDSGVDDALNEEVILGEHEALLESDVNDEGLETDTEVEKLTQNGNMEQLAELVLNGEGRRLVGRQSSNPELQSFIDNVPAYMGKIHAVHMAAREGNLRDLQSALDRRKFAIARDGSSPHGATPLHVAVIFGHTAIIRYLAGRFPETAHAMDLDGRTPLHYAATLADNGHYYNLLLHLGANPLIQDKTKVKVRVQFFVLKKVAI